MADCWGQFYLCTKSLRGCSLSAATTKVKECCYQFLSNNVHCIFLFGDLSQNNIVEKYSHKNIDAILFLSFRLRVCVVTAPCPTCVPWLPGPADQLHTKVNYGMEI